MEVWQTSNLRRLRLDEERKKKKEEDRNHRAKIYWSALLHRATITRLLNVFVMVSVGIVQAESEHYVHTCVTGSK